MQYTGGKNGNGVYQTIINQFPPHEHYIEGFLGSGAILRYKKSAISNIGIDLSVDAIRAFQQFTFKGQVYRDEFLKAIKRLWYDNKTLIYLDPPYIKDSRRNPRDIYTHEMTDKQHMQLLTWAIEATEKEKPMIAISHYRNPLYDKMLKGWRTLDYTTGTHAGPVTETLYMNYPQPEQLHEYTYLGNDCWDRQRIKRRIKLLANKLSALPPYERQAVLDSLQYIQK
jgi:DNA adenine methylase